MSNGLEIKLQTEGKCKKFIVADGINSKIEINETDKEVKNLKSFFQEIIFKSYYEGSKYQLFMSKTLEENGIAEVNTIISELIDICNKEPE